jgi:hypothetical protein
MRGLSELAIMERNAIFTLVDLMEKKKEASKWVWFFRIHLVPFVFNIATLIPIYDQQQALLFGLLGLLTPETFMAAVNELCNGFSSLAFDGSNHPVMLTFNNIIPGHYKEREQLVIFSDLLANFRQNNPQMDESIIPELYALRNYYLMKDEILQSFQNFQMNEQSVQQIEDIYPTELLVKLGLVNIFTT